METQEHRHEHKNEAKSTADHIRQWATPLLILVIGWLLSDKMGQITKKLEIIETLQIAQTQMRAELDGLRKDLDRLEKRQDEDDRYHADKIYKEAEKNLRRPLR